VKHSTGHYYKGKGCARCRQTGYFGRLAILEAMAIDDPMRDLIVKRTSSFQIKDYAIKHGMITLREDCIRKFCQGLTTLDEVIRITTEDEESG
jgi:type IV pilus assembly protein PilB